MCSMMSGVAVAVSANTGGRPSQSMASPSARKLVELRTHMATDAAETDPPQRARRLQFRLATLLLLPIVVVYLLLLLLLERRLPPSRTATIASATLDFQVTDADTGKPVDGALIEVFPRGKAKPIVIGSATAGRARITHDFAFVGERSLLGSRRSFGIEPLVVKISAPKYMYLLLPLNYNRSLGAGPRTPSPLYKYRMVRANPPGVGSVE
jgi:hypothetical protein